MTAIDMTGKRFGRLVVIERAGSRHAQAVWRCRCDCGAEAIIPGGSLRSGRQVSCGCRQREARSERRGRYRVARPTYLGAHYRVSSARGPAASHQCAHCGRSAEQWAYDHSDPEALTAVWADQKGKQRVVSYSGDPDRYLPLCRPCHTRMDRSVAA